MQEPCTFSFVINQSSGEDDDHSSHYVISGINLGFALATLAAVATRHHVTACCGNQRAGGGGLDLFLIGSLAFQSFFLWSVASTVREFLGKRFRGIWNLLKIRLWSFFKKRGGGSSGGSQTGESQPAPRARRNIRESWKVGTIHVEA